MYPHEVLTLRFPLSGPPGLNLCAPLRLWPRAKEAVDKGGIVKNQNTKAVIPSNEGIPKENLETLVMPDGSHLRGDDPWFFFFTRKSRLCA